ncbi:MAG: DUF72 domain-containing protein [Spirulinaceae cyanobacterium]
MKNFHLGCAVWSYKGWVGDFFPPKTKAEDFLTLYGQRLTAVEGNTTFYGVPEAKTVVRWGQQTPSGFKFCPKLPKTITHSGSLQTQIDAASKFLTTMENLGDRLGPIFAQLPPSYSPASWEDLKFFLQAWPQDRHSLAVEVRHQDWFREPYNSQLNALLSQLKIGRVLLDSRPIYNCPDDPQLNSQRRKPKLPLLSEVTANFSIIRFISHPQAEFNQSFLKEWVSLLQKWLDKGIEVYFFVHCPTEDYSPHTAKQFQEILESEVAAIPPLPWKQISYPQQLSLF